ncbi:hypothetical protein F4779DRAFT_315729 [Xylariaceae sp. FL0662B]|nr:hypothetical protein F4779DRAFT_315729 [Xylariaceae sp. FL0662B]
MVQNTGQPRDQFPHLRTPYWPQERLAMEPISDSSRFSDSQDVRRPPMAIDKALREYCNITAEFYVLIPIIEGEPHIFTAPSIVPSLDISRFLDVDALRRELQRTTQSATNPPYAETDFGFDSELSRYPLETGRRWTQDRRYGQSMGLNNFEDDGNFKARKRQRRRDTEAFEGEPTTSTSSAKRGITIGDGNELWTFYDQRFRNCQQTACKMIAKAWVKAVEPKKQSTHPYTGADEKAPDWWPKPWGTTKDDKVRHKEPDHLYKNERVHLLNHILRMIVEPNHKQHPSIQKLFLNVDKLEEITNEALSSFFTDKDNPSNMQKRPFLKEIFKVARQEERFRDGQIDGSTKVFVMPDDRLGQGYVSDPEDLNPLRDDGDQNPTPASSNASPQRANTSQPLIPQSHNAGGSPASQMSGEGFVGDIPVRSAHFPQPVMGPEMTAERPAFVEATSMPGQPSLHTTASLGLQTMYTSPHDSSRRSSIFASPSEYASPATPTMYPQWQTGSAAPSNAPVYAFPQQAASGHPPFVGQPGVEMPQNQQYLGAGFDGLPRGPHDAHHGNIYRPGGVGQSSLPQPNYPGYMSHEGGTIPGPGVKADTLSRHPPQ